MIKAILALIKGIICSNKEADELRSPTSTEEIKIGDLRTLLRGKFKDADIFLSDMTYKLCDASDIAYFLKQDKTNRYKYSASFDCDNFSYRLMGQFSVPEWSPLAFGIVWTEKHALNCFIDTNEEFWFVEPMQDKVQKELSSWQGSLVRLIII